MKVVNSKIVNFYFLYFFAFVQQSFPVFVSLQICISDCQKKKMVILVIRAFVHSYIIRQSVKIETKTSLGILVCFEIIWNIRYQLPEAKLTDLAIRFRCLLIIQIIVYLFFSAFKFLLLSVSDELNLKMCFRCNKF